MKTVHKFLLAPRGAVQRIMLPAGAVVMKIEDQYGSPYAWVFLDTSLPYNVPHDFVIVGTGDLVPDGFWPHGTFMEHGGAFVWHAFMRAGVSHG